MDSVQRDSGLGSSPPRAPERDEGDCIIMKVAAALVAGSLALAGCASPTPYQPLGAETGVSGGYSNQRITNDQYRVMFSGNTMTSRQTVETYLLYRAAELTTQQGYDWFVMTDRNTDRKTRTYVDHPFGTGP